MAETVTRQDAGGPIVLDGKTLAAEIKEDLKLQVQDLKRRGVTVGLGTVLVGEDPGSVKYVAGKHKDCEDVGIDSIRIDLPDTAGPDDVVAAVEDLNNDPACTGYIVQLPLPDGIDESWIIRRIDPMKDVDGLHPTNLGEIVLHPRGFPNGIVPVPMPCTPKGIITLLRHYGVPLDGANVCVVGRGVTVGRTIGLLLTGTGVNATVDLCHTGTKDLIDHARRADIIISCAGRAGLVTPDWLGDHKGGVTLVDVGVSRVVDPVTGSSKIYGDVDRACWIDPRVRAYTPNPGGVGPMTRVSLLQNVVSMAELKGLHNW